jgi:hypothetical protein
VVAMTAVLDANGKGTEGFERALASMSGCPIFSTERNLGIPYYEIPMHCVTFFPQRRNNGENTTIWPFYAASRMSQLRKSSSAVSQLRKINEIN